ncbi:dTMP kinase [bacterium]|nr:dTMP kinase [bacterium]
MKKRNRGVLIVLEGIDGSGKTTQARMLLDKLQKKEVEAVYLQEPSESKWGQEIKKKAAVKNSLSPEEELDLFLKDRKENVEKNIKPALKKNQVVILDRYYFSTMAYQGAKGIDLQLIRKKNEEIIVPPDLIFVLDINAQNGLRRLQNRKKDLLFERTDYLVKVRKIFQSFQGENFIHIDAQKDKENIHREILRVVVRYLTRLDFVEPE